MDPNQPVDEARNKIFRKFSIIDRTNSQGKKPEDYVLKASGFREYLLSNVDLGNNRHLSSTTEGFKLIDYDYIRYRISKKQQIELTLVEASELYEQVAEVEEESFIDHILNAEYENDQKALENAGAGTSKLY